MPIVTALYAGLLGLISIALGAQAGRLRGKFDISIGDGGNRELLLAMRRHANFAEWVPLALIIIVLLEMSGTSRTAIHALGAALVIARLSHATALRADSMQGIGRAIGAVGTILIILIASVWLIVKYFTQ